MWNVTLTFRFLSISLPIGTRIVSNQRGAAIPTAKNINGIRKCSSFSLIFSVHLNMLHIEVYCDSFATHFPIEVFWLLNSNKTFGVIPT